MNDEEIRAATIGEPTLHNGPIELVLYDPSWPKNFACASESRNGTNTVSC